MKFELLTLPSLTIAGIAARTSNATPEVMGALWRRFHAENPCAGLIDRLGDEVYSLYTDYEGDHTKPFTILIGHAVSSGAAIPDGLETRRLPAAKYAVFDGSGPQPASLIAAWSAIWKEPLDRAYIADFELYRPDGTMGVHVGIR